MTQCPHNWPEGRKAEWIVGIQRDLEGKPIFILWQCLCRGSVTIMWDEATEFMREAALEKERGRGR